MEVAWWFSQAERKAEPYVPWALITLGQWPGLEPSLQSKAYKQFLLLCSPAAAGTSQNRHRAADPVSVSLIMMPGQGQAELCPLTLFILYAPCLAILAACWEISPFSCCLQTGLSQEADPHGNSASKCLPTAGSVTPQGPSNYSRECHRILKAKFVLIYSKFKNKYALFWFGTAW